MIVTNRLIKKLLFTLFAVFISNSAVAEWNYVGETEESTVFIDSATISKKGNMSKMWVMFDYKHGQGSQGFKFLSRRDQFEFDCDEKLVRTLFVSVHSGNMGDGKSHIGDNPSLRWQPIPPETTAEVLRTLACGEPFLTQILLKTLASQKAAAILPEAPDWKSPEWRYYDVDGYDKPAFYYDPTTIQKNNQFRKVWSRYSGNSYYDQRTLFEFDCQKEWVKILKYDTAPSALNRPDFFVPPPLSGAHEGEWVSLKSGKYPDYPDHPSYPYYPSDDVKTLFKIVC